MNKQRWISAALGASALVGLMTQAAASAVDSWREDPRSVLEARDVDLEEFKWIARPIIVFAETSLDPAFEGQIRHFMDAMDEVVERDIAIIVDTDPQQKSELRRTMRPHGFMLVLVGKDGMVKLRKPFPWNMVEISGVIDKMPMRQREIRQRRGAD